MDIGIIFDSDGVVVDSEQQSLVSFREAIEEQGITLTEEDLWLCCGLTDVAIIERLQKKYETPIDISLFRRRKFDLYFKEVDEAGLRVFPGVIQLLDTLESAGVPYVLASSGPPEKIEYNLTRVHLFSRFEHIISGEDVVESKPAPYIFLEAASRIHTPPQRCVVIEDSPNGLLGAKRAGMKSIGVRTTFKDDTILKDADYIVDSLEDIDLELLNSLITAQAR